MIIYKITNLVNKKVYIGLTTCSLDYRWSRHITESKNVLNTKHLYKSMRKYGINNFIIEKIAETNSFEELGELERKYIKEFNSQNPKYGYNLTAGGEKNQYDGNPSSKLTIEDVVRIREIYSFGELRLKECWKMYSDKISYSGFQKIWEGITWKGIMDEVYSEENIQKHSSQKSNPGSSNGNSLFTEDEVLEIRKYYSNHTLDETYEKYGKRASKSGFRQILDRTYKNVPMYSKIHKKWFLNNEIINIEDYNPVSTICESAE